MRKVREGILRTKEPIILFEKKRGSAVTGWRGEKWAEESAGGVPRPQGYERQDSSDGTVCSSETTGIIAAGRYRVQSRDHRDMSCRTALMAPQDTPTGCCQALWRSVRKSRRVFTRSKLEARGVFRLFSKAEEGFTVITGPGLWILQISGY